jgi:hypothetical protein
MEIVLNYLQNEKHPHIKSILILLLHDVVESDPKRWWDVLALVPIDVFVRIIKLSKPDVTIVTEMRKFFITH